MERPILVNVVSPTPDGKRVLIATVLNLHPNNVSRIVNQPKENTVGVLLKEDNSFYTIAISFKEMLKIYQEMHPIDLRYEHDVMSYLKDNFSINGDKRP